jgi:hypothetical protein
MNERDFEIYGGRIMMILPPYISIIRGPKGNELYIAFLGLT